jgi:hypothetical protein
MWEWLRAIAVVAVLQPMVGEVGRPVHDGPVGPLIWSLYAGDDRWIPSGHTIGASFSDAERRGGLFELYALIWEAIGDDMAPVSGGRGATARDDYLDGKALRLPLLRTTPWGGPLSAR